MGVRKLMRREGFRHVSARPIHPKANTAKQTEFREIFAQEVGAVLRESKEPNEGRQVAEPEAAQPQEEQRKTDRDSVLGRGPHRAKGSLTRVWAPQNTRPRIARDHRYGYCYLYAAACGERQATAGPVASKANTAYMNQHLAAIREEVSEGSIGVVVLDGAGWHKSKGLKEQDNIRLLVLPPYRPELNPMEQVFQYLKIS